ncbi:MAG: phage holin family protein [Verrucomicrobiales bacterium]
MEPSHPSKSPSRRLKNAVSETCLGFLDSLHARWDLLRLEAREAGRDLVLRLLCFLVAGLFCLLAYLAALTGAVAWLAASQGWEWYIVALVAAGIHLAGAVVLVLVGKRRFGRPPFRDSLAELKRDREWVDEMRRRP